MRHEGCVRIHRAGRGEGGLTGEMPSWMVWGKVGTWEPGQEVEAKVGALGACSGGLVAQGKPWQGCEWRVC